MRFQRLNNGYPARKPPEHQADDKMKNENLLIHKVVLTEKGTILSEVNNQYVFKVATDANKLEIKDAVQKLFGVKVTKVNTMHRKGKKKRERRQSYGITAAWKKAVVTLAEGNRIDLT
jgi:large subunit ribosomal protein L23